MAGRSQTQCVERHSKIAYVNVNVNVYIEILVYVIRNTHKPYFHRLLYIIRIHHTTLFTFSMPF